MPQCESHERSLERIAACETTVGVVKRTTEIHEGQIDELFIKADQAKDSNAVILNKLIKIEANQELYLKNQQEHMSRIEKLCDVLNTFKSEVNKQITDINKFKWFRDSANKVRDKIAFILIIIVFALLFAGQYIQIDKLLRFLKGS